MFDAIKKLMSDLGEGGKPAAQFGEGDYRLAAAALLVHAAGIDGNIVDVERQKLHAVIKQRFTLDDAGADKLIAVASEAERQAIDLYQFTTRLNRTLNAAGRAHIVEMLWQIVCADGIITEFEDNLVWRAADLLGVSRDERIALRERVMGTKR
jgi:uncharacterized tellurite resistance protein B-like protein